MALTASPAQSHCFVAAPPFCVPLPQDLSLNVPGSHRRCSCTAVRAADVGVSDEWASLLDPGEGTTRSHGHSKRPALRAKGGLISTALIPGSSCTKTRPMWFHGEIQSGIMLPIYCSRCTTGVQRLYVRAVQHLRSMAMTLARLTTAQFSVVQHLLSDRIVDATSRARVINRTNQGRSREEKLISKLLMSEHTDPELAEIEVCRTLLLFPLELRVSISWSSCACGTWATLQGVCTPFRNTSSSSTTTKTTTEMCPDCTAAQCYAMQGAIAAILTPGGSKQGTSQATALAESWCSRLLANSTSVPSADSAAYDDDAAATVHAAANGATEADVAQLNSVDAESEVIDAAIAAGEDISHFRALLRRARSAAEAASDAAHMGPDAGEVGSSALRAARAAAQLQVLYSITTRHACCDE